MTRLALIALAAGALLAGCDKPKPEDCRKALLNMQHLLGTENLNDTSTLEGEVRRCRGGSKRKAVACAIKAETLDELRACDFYKLPDKATKGGGPAPAPSGSAAGSAAPAGSAGPSMSPPGGTPPAGSAVPAGSAAAGSATPAASGAAGSAAPAGSATPAGSTGSAK